MLKMELERLALSLPADVLCADTLEGLRIIDPRRETTQGNDLNGAMAESRRLSTPAFSNQRPSSLTSSGQATDRSREPMYFSSEITPVKSDDDTTQPFANPPPAPKKKRTRPENGRHRGNMSSAKRRLLQDESVGSGAFSLDTCAASPPPSPQRLHRSLARRRLAFTDGSGESSHSNSSTSIPVEFKRDLEKGDNCNELLPFPDDFSDSESEADIKDQSAGVVNHNSNDHWSTSQGVEHLIAVSNNYTDSLPDEDLISTVDQLLDQTPKQCSSGASHGFCIVTEGTKSLETQNHGHTGTATATINSVENQNEGGHETRKKSLTHSLGEGQTTNSATQSHNGKEATNSSATQNEDGHKTTNTTQTLCLSDGKATNSAIQSHDGKEAPNSSVTQSEDGHKTMNSSATQNYVQHAPDKSSGNNSAEGLTCSKASAVYSGQVTPRKQDQSNVRTVSATTKDMKNHTNQMTAMHSDNRSASVSSPSTTNSHKSFKLMEIYKRVFGCPPKVSHAAEDDCLTLVRIIQTCAKEFGKWSDENATPFSDVKKMY